jgi:superfamily II DNA or RNA helicase
MLQQSPTCQVGSIVHLRGSRWRIVELLGYDGCAMCTVTGAEGTNLHEQRSVLLPFDRPRPVVRVECPRRVSRARGVLAVRALAAEQHAYGSLRGMGTAKIDVLPYQLEPGLALARGATRVLIADDVGLGKTIQAAVMLADLFAREMDSRALVLTPASLCSQWHKELSVRFGLTPVAVDALALRTFVDVGANDDSPWNCIPLAISSVDYIKQVDVLQGMADARRWDLLVVDEAHLCAVARERAAAVASLARRSRQVVLLTATPHSGIDGAFESLCRIGAIEPPDPIVLFRRTRAELGLPVSRRVRTMRVRLCPPERRLHALLERYTARVWRESGVDVRERSAKLAMVILQKRAASGVMPLLVSLERRLRFLAPLDPDVGRQIPLPLDDGDGSCEAEDEEPSASLNAPGLRDEALERRTLIELIRRAREAAGTESKVRVLRRLVARTDEPLLVFTEYRDTLEHLAGEIGLLTSVTTLHGGMDQPARSRAVRMFTEGRCRVMLATDAASHGLNLQHACRLVVNLELPWNPVRLEQRIGRLDRIGQRRVVHAVNLVAGGTSESHVLARLTARLQQTRHAVGAFNDVLGRLSEDEIAAGVFTRRASWMRGTDCRSAPSPLPPCFRTCTTSLLPRARSEAAQQTTLRGLLSCGEARLLDVRAELGEREPWHVALRRRGRPEMVPLGHSVVCVYGLRFIDRRGVTAEQRLLVLRIERRNLIAGSHRQTEERPGLSPELRAAFDAVACREAARRLESLTAEVSVATSEWIKREEVLATAREAGPLTEIQPGLFDHRAVAAADADDRRRAQHRADGAAARLVLAQAADLTVETPELHVVLFVE